MMSKPVKTDLNAALQQIEYLNLLVVSSAAAPDRLPYLRAHPEMDVVAFQQQMGSLVCLMQAHFADLVNVLHGDDTQFGRFADFRPLIARMVTDLESGMPAQQTLHRHMRNLFAFETLVHTDQMGEYGTYFRDGEHDYKLAIDWLMEMLSCIECGFKMHELLGEAQNTDVCTRLCFGDAMNTLETWRRSLQLIVPGSASVM